MTEPLLENPTLPEVFRLAMDVVSTELCVAMPGVVTAYDEDTHLAEVQPLLKTRSRTEARAASLAVIPRVPVAHPRTAKGSLILPIAAGDPVTLLFSDRALDRWKAGDAINSVEPETGRKHSLSDCWAIPGGYPEGRPLPPVSSGNLALQVAPGTKVYIGNGATELLDLVDQVITQVSAKIDADVILDTGIAADPVLTTAAAAAGAHSASVTAIKVLLTALQTQLEQLKA